jgi:hypothetical protein
MSAKKIPSPRATRADRATRPGFEIPPFTLEGWEAHALAPLPDLAEDRAQLRLLEARQLRAKTGRPTAETKALEEAAERWRDLARLSEADAAPLVAGWEQAATEAIDGLLIRAGADSMAALVNLLMVATRAFYGLRGLAAGGNVAAGGMLMAALAKEAADFELLAWHKPEIFRAGARKLSQIPGTIGRHPDKVRGNADLAERLEVGADCDIASVPKKGQTNYWGHETPANVFALKLKSYIAHVRAGAALFDEPISPPEWFTDALALEDFAPGTWKEWEAVAWRILDNGKHPALSNYGTQPANRNSGRGGGVDLGNSDTRTALKSAFRTIATGKARKK